eukprot:1159338-Pelagomonas_calceolata.AAC.18
MDQLREWCALDNPVLIDDAASVMTADEDAFDVTEAFDEGVDYGILDDDDMDEPTDNEDPVLAAAAACIRAGRRGDEIAAACRENKARNTLQCACPRGYH